METLPANEETLERSQRALTAVVAAGLAAMAGALSLSHHAPFGPPDSSTIAWMAEMGVVLSGIALCWQSLRTDSRPEGLAVTVAVALVVLTMLHNHARPIGVEGLTLRYAAVFAVVFLLLPIARRAAPLLAAGCAVAYSVTLWSLPQTEADGTALGIAFAAALIVLLSGCYAAMRRAPLTEPQRASPSGRPLLAIINHEMRTPLNAITGFASILAQKPAVADDPELAELVTQLSAAGRRMARLTDDLLDIEQAGQARLSLEISRVDLGQLVEEVLASFQPLAVEHSVQLQPIVEAHRPVLVMADAGRVRQVLGNLIANAIKFNRPGGSISIMLRISQRHGSVIVTDDGPGIPPDKIARLFGMFDRLDISRQKAPGHGIGLALCKALTEAMGGSIGAESVIGSGSAFTVDLPLAGRTPRAVETASATEAAVG